MNIPWSPHCQSFWILNQWTFDKNCGSCMMVSQPVSVTLPEITLKLPTWGSGYRKVGTPILAKSFTNCESLDFFLWGHKKKWHTLQQWIMQRNCGSRFRVVVPWFTTLGIFKSIHQSMNCHSEACVAVQDQHFEHLL